MGYAILLRTGGGPQEYSFAKDFIYYLFLKLKTKKSFHKLKLSEKILHLGLKTIFARLQMNQYGFLIWSTLILINRFYKICKK